MKKLYFLIALSILSFGAFAQPVTVYIYSGTGGMPHADSVTGYSLDYMGTFTHLGRDTIYANGFEKGYAVFSLASIPAGANIINCTVGYNILVYNAGTTSWSTYGYAGSLSTVTSATALYADCTSGTLLSSATYGTAVGDNELSLTTPFFNSNIGSQVSVCFNAASTTSAGFTIRGESGAEDTTGDHTPFLRITYCDLPAISGIKNVCPGTSVTLSDTSPGGTWSSSSTAIASVGTGGTVTGGPTAGTAVIYYNVSGCQVADTITVGPLPAIGGPTSMCSGSCDTQTNSVAGGTWSSGSPAVVTISAISGVACGVSAGTAIITYTTAPGCDVTKTITVNPVPSLITGNSTICTGTADTLTAYVDGAPVAPTSGTWTSSNTTIASVNPAGVVIAGTSTGTATIIFAIGTCATSFSLSVISTPASISPPTPVTVCIGTTAALTDGTSGGTWSSANTSVATVTSGGTVTGVSAGTAIISYGAGGACSVAKTVTVTALPAITPNKPFDCVGGTIALTDPSGGGTWSSSNTAVANITSGGSLTGLATGTSVIDYTTTTGCVAKDTVTIFNGAGTISPSGTVSICSGSVIDLTDGTLSGTWSSSSTTIATVTSGGAVSGVSSGTATISFTIDTVIISTSTTCYTTQNVTVTSGTGGITPSSTGICIGNTATLTPGSGGGTWSSSNTGVATVAGGTVGAVAAGTATISYTIGTCTATATVTVSAPPSAITPAGVTSLCLGGTASLGDPTAGGAWSSSNTAVATISSAGLVASDGVGTTTITYSLNGCSVSKTVNVSTGPGAITPNPAAVCVGNTTSLSDPTGGGIWSSSNPTVATVNSSGLVSGVAVGTATISYSLGACTVTDPLTISNPPVAIAVTGATTICAGSTTSVSDGTTGGTWSSSNTAVATVSSTGTVTGLSGGTASIIYTAGGCSVNTIITVTSSPAAISPLSATICTGTSTTFSESVGGGAWSSTNAAVATVTSSGSVTGLTVGTATISYVIGSCGTAATVSVNLSASAGTISGPSEECVGSTALVLVDTASGGSWSSSNASVATVAAGVVGGVSGGTATISYTVSNGCGTSVATQTVTINTSPTAGFIVGPSLICAGTYTGLTDVVAGGTWSSSNTSASITSTGLFTGITPGTDTVTYNVVASCGTAATTKVITIGPFLTAGFISGPISVCQGSAITLIDPAPDGVWSAFNYSMVTVGLTGTIGGSSPGVDTIYYTVTSSCGSAVAEYAITINPLTPASGAISGPTGVCVGSTIPMSETVGGGAWSMTNTSASISSVGVVTGAFAGIDTVKYTVSGACGAGVAIYPVTISTVPTAAPIGGAGSLCAGAFITLTDATPGGVWSSSNTLVASVDASGNVIGVTAGTANITYTVTNACGTANASATVTVNPSGSAGVIGGPDSVCVFSTIVLTDPIPGGTWSASNTNVTVSTGGVVTGVAGGSVNITYTVTTGCGTAFSVRTLSVVTLTVPGTISGISIVCLGSGITWTASIPGGSWVASNTHASVIAPGIVTGVSLGVDTIFYDVSGGCGIASTYKVVSVDPLPVVTPVIGPTEHCVGTSITLTDAVTGGTWTSSTPSVATIGLTSGLSMGVSLGVTTLTYTVTNIYGCPASVTIPDTVVSVPVIPAILGSTHVCFGASTTLTDSITGGTWSSSNTFIASVNASSGVVTGMAVGTATITYTVANMCGLSSITRTESVNPLPPVSPIVGTLSECVGASTSLADATVGGVWSSTNTSVATANSATGLVTGILAGTVTIDYTYTNSYGCSFTVTAVNTVNPLPVIAPITGTLKECVGATTSLADATTGGTWSSGGATVATVDAAGTVTGVGAGTVNISYTVTSGGCTASATAVDTVIAPPAPTPITGTMHACIDGTTTLSNATPYGTWTSGNTAIATVGGGSGVVSGIVAGTVEIYYAVANSCGSPVTDSASVTINPLPTPGVITASFTTLCASSTITLGESIAGGVWSSDDTSIATVNGAGVVTGITAGTATIRYTVTSTFGCTNSTTINLTVNGASLAATLSPASTASICHGHPVNMYVSTGGGVTYQWLRDGTYIPGATDSNYTATTAGIYSVIISNGFCSRTVTSINVVSMSLPAISFTSPNVLYTSSYYTYQWFKNGIAIVGATNGIFDETGPGVYTVEVWDVTGCFDTSAPYTVYTGGATNGVGNVVTGADIKVYPNPASNVVRIDAPEKVSVALVGMDGKILIDQKETNELDVSRLPDGIYLIMIYDQNNVLLKMTKFAKIE